MLDLSPRPRRVLRALILLFGAYACADKVLSPKPGLKSGLQTASDVDINDGTGTTRILPPTFNGLPAGGSSQAAGSNAAQNCSSIQWQVARITNTGKTVTNSQTLCFLASDFTLAGQVPANYEFTLIWATGTKTVPYTVSSGQTTTVASDLTNVFGQVTGAVTINGAVPAGTTYTSCLISAPDGGCVALATVGTEARFRFWALPSAAGQLQVRHSAFQAVIGTYTFSPPAAGQSVNAFVAADGTTQTETLNVADPTGSVLFNVPTYLGQPAGGLGAPSTSSPVAANNCGGISLVLLRGTTQVTSRNLCQLSSDVTVAGLTPGTNYSVIVRAFTPAATTGATIPVTVATGQTAAAQFELGGFIGQVAGTLTANGAPAASGLYKFCIGTIQDSGCPASNAAAGAYKLWTWGTGSNPIIQVFRVSDGAQVGGTFSFTPAAGQTATLNIAVTDVPPVSSKGTLLISPPTFGGQMAGGSTGGIAGANCGGINFQVTTATNSSQGAANLCSLSASVGFTLNPGQYKVRVLWNNGGLVTAKETGLFDVATGQTTTVPVIDLADVFGQVTGTLTVDGAAPPPNRFSVCLGSPGPLDGCSSIGSSSVFRLWAVQGTNASSVAINGAASPIAYTFNAANGLALTLNDVKGGPPGETPSGLNVEVQPAANLGTTATNASITTTFSSVGSAGRTMAIQSSTAPTGIPASITPGSPAFNYTVTSTATFGGAIKVCVDYTGQTIANPAQLNLFQRDPAGNWGMITTTRDQANRIVCGQTNTLGVFLAGSGTFNRAPTITQITSSPAFEGGAADIAVSAADPDAGDVLTYQWDLGADGTIEQTTSTPNAQFTFADNGSYAVRVTVSDETGASATADGTIVVSNALPQIQSLASSPVNPGTPATIDVAFNDAGVNDGAWTITVDWGDGATTSYPALAQGSVPVSHVYTLRGAFTASVSVRDKDGGECETKSVGISIQNRLPMITVMGASDVAEGTTVTYTAVGNDPDGDPLTYSWTFGGSAGGSSAASPAWTWPDNGNFTVTVRVSDGYGPDVVSTLAVAVSNVAPTATLNAPSSGIEGASFSVSLANPMDQPADMAAGFSYAFACGTDAYGVFDSSASSSCTPADNPSLTVRAKIRDKDGGVTEYTRDVPVANANPVVTSLTTPINPTPINTSVSISAAFTDQGSLDTHTAVITWDDGTTSSGTVNATSRTVSAAHTYTAPGVYVVTMRVNDKDAGSGALVASQYIVVYDPSAGFVTGGGWFTSGAGAYLPDASMTGKASFGFVAKYKKGQTVPDGETEFQFQAGNLNFNSASYEWLVVSGTKAQYRGAGSVNGVGGYTFMLTAIDGAPDKVRMKIWDASGQVIYDNQRGAADTADPVTAIGGGSIVIHKA